MNWRLSWSWLFKWTGYNQVKILLTRLDSTDYGIFGHMVLDDNSFDCVTLENHELSIPAGTYKVTLYNSPEHGLVPLLNDVPGRSFIEIHEGNWDRQSLGCILVGEKRDGEAIDNSKGTIVKLVEILKGKDDISITIS